MNEVRKKIEQYILAACIIEGSAIESVQFLSEKNFSVYEYDHRLIFQAIKNMSGKQPIDIATVAFYVVKLHGREYLNYILDITSMVASTHNIQHHSAILLQIDMTEKLLKTLSHLVIDSRLNTLDVAILNDVINDLKINDVAIWESVPAILEMFEQKKVSQLIIDELVSFNSVIDKKITQVRENTHRNEALHSVYRLCKTDIQKYYFNQLKESL